MNIRNQKIEKYPQVTLSFCSKSTLDLLPDTIKIDGSIHANITDLPESFSRKTVICSGSFWFFHGSGFLPRTLIALGSLMMPYSREVKKLPEELIICEDLDIQNCSGIKEIDERSVINGKIVCSKGTGFCQGVKLSVIPKKLPIPEKFKDKIEYKL